MERKKCPYCGEDIAVTAKKCRFCGEWLTDATVGNAPVIENVETPEPVAETPEPVTENSEPVTETPETVTETSETENDTPDWTTYSYEPKKGFFETYFIDPYIRKYADFQGYSSRKEFWLSYLALTVVTAGLAGLVLLISAFGGTIGTMVSLIIMSLVSLALTVPGIAICVRRLRDAGFSPLFVLLSFIPIIGALALLVMFCLPSKQDCEQSDESCFNTKDGIIATACVALLIAGLWNAAKSLDSIIGSDSDSEDYKEMSSYHSYDNSDVEESEDVLGDEDAEVFSDPSGYYIGMGEINERYPIRIHLQLTPFKDGYSITGRYAYESVLDKYGSGDSSWFIIQGHLDERGKMMLLTYQYGSSDAGEVFLSERCNFNPGVMRATGKLSDLKTNEDFTLSFMCRIQE